jgi:hypothetical protein
VVVTVKNGLMSLAEHLSETVLMVPGICVTILDKPIEQADFLQL